MKTIPLPLLLLLPVSSAHVLPPTNGTHWWHPEPHGRGTASILLTSSITLTFCVWTSIHLGLSQRTSSFNRVLRKLAMMFIGLVAPEIVLFIALAEFRSARAMHSDWRSHFDIKRGSSKDKLGLTGSFFAGMGGLVLGERDEFGGFPAVLTARGFLQIVLAGHVSRSAVKKKQIQDKGKSDNLGKALVCSQALYMVVGCVVRWRAGLTVTLLEGHVVLHVLCTFATYAFWWYKPQDVAEPIAVVKERELAALLSVVYGRHVAKGVMVGRYEGIRTGFKGLAVGPEWGQATALSDVTAVKFHGKVRKDQGRLTGKVRDVFPGETLFVGEELTVRYLLPAPTSTSAKLDEKDLNTLLLAAAALRTRVFTVHELALSDPARAEVWVMREEQLYETANSKFFMTATGLLQLVITMLYGAAHAAAWNASFPSVREENYWRMATVLIMAGTLIVGMISIVGMRAGMRPMVMHLMIILLFPTLAVMTVARGYLTVGSFLSLRSLPEKAYESTPWEELWPHW